MTQAIKKKKTSKKKTAPALPKKRTRAEIMGNIQALTSTLLRRRQLGTSLGQSYGGDRELYTVLGYTESPTPDDYRNTYDREGIPGRVNDAPCDAIWRLPPRIFDVVGEKEDSEFTKGVAALIKKHRLWHRFNRADKLLGFGEYSILLLGFDDVKNKEDWKKEVTKGSKLLYVQCYPQDSAGIDSFEKDPNNERYNQPAAYTVNTAVNRGSNDKKDKEVESSSITVQYSRVIHLSQDNLDDDVYGKPRLERPYNRLMDILKIVGGSGEMYWRGAFPGRHIKIDKEFNWDEADPSTIDLDEQLDEFEHGLRRFIFGEGFTFEELKTQIADPTNHLDVQLTDLSAGSRIPKRLLTGSERGELASSQDEKNWADYINERRRFFAEPVILRPFIDRLVEYGVLAEPKEGEYTIDWPDMRSPSDKEKAEIGETRSKSLKNYATAPKAEQILPIEMFYRYAMGLDEEAIEEVKAYYEEQVERERKQVNEDAQVMEEEENEEDDE